MNIVIKVKAQKGDLLHDTNSWLCYNTTHTQTQSTSGNVEPLMRSNKTVFEVSLFKTMNQNGKELFCFAAWFLKAPNKSCRILVLTKPKTKTTQRSRNASLRSVF